MKYTVTGARAYDVADGETVNLDPTDPLVQLNVRAGILTPSGTPAKMTCPACAGEGLKRPKRLVDQEDLDEHYRDRHPAVVPPEWKEGESE